jgi:hypothetical protein
MEQVEVCRPGTDWQPASDTYGGLLTFEGMGAALSHEGQERRQEPRKSRPGLSVGSFFFVTFVFLRSFRVSYSLVGGL